ncbi:MAG: isoleucine--tRNA ligase [Fidelibacterota bacterium]|nr:MAG: isoleucine--tRNA ligase [Candidatus Neomarinimicrobiota bacterium]
MKKNYHPVNPKVDFISQEHEVLQWWENHKTFQKLVAKNKGRQRWSFLDGPITANNPMGVHHAWGRTYKDIFQRYHAMQGCEQRYQNGFDCQGLWVEVEVERELGFESKRDIEEYGMEKFVNRCKERVRKYAQIQTEQSIRLGYWMDWDNSYYTMSDENNYTIWEFLKRIHERGWLKKGEDCMPWCPRCGTGISQHEMTEGYREIDDKSVYLLFPLEGHDNEYLVVWTTTPWTLSSNVAAAVADNLDYVAVKDNDRTLYLLPEAVPRLFGKKASPEVVRRLKGAEMMGWTYRGPFDELPALSGVKHRIIPWEEVSADEGSGIVHIAPGCGKEDFDLAHVYDLAVIAPLDENGVYLEGFDWLSGQHVEEVAEPIISNLKEKGILLKQELYRHRYPHCWRCKTKLVFRVVAEWYITMDELRYQIMEVAKQIHWMPAFGLDRELDWLNNMDDWMISKKRYWGLALPIYECEKCNTITVIGSRGELHEKAVEGWDRFDGQSPHRPWVDEVKVACSQCGEPVSRIKDVGNPWLDAGIVPFSTIHYHDDHEYWEKWFPADFITESFPGQFRNWFYCLLAMSTVLENRPPFKKVLGHALVKDEHGKDMHKSEGNAIWFDEAAEKMGVDVMRWIYAEQNPEHNLLFGYHHANEVRRKLLTLWNSYSFFVTYASLDHFNPVKDAVPHNERIEIDHWLVARTQQLIATAVAAYEDYRTDRLMRAADSYLEDLSNWYIRRNRRRFWKSEHDTDKLTAYTTLHEALVTLVKLLAPIIPFVTEAIYRNLVCALDPEAPESVHLCDFPAYQAELVDEDLLTEIDSVISVVALGRSARNKANIKIRQPLSEIVVSGDARVLSAVEKNRNQLLEELNIKSLRTDLPTASFIRRSIEPNLPLLGPRFGKDLEKVRRALESLPPEETVARLHQRESVEIEIDGLSTTLEPDEILVNEEGVLPYVAATSRDMAVGINTELTDELLQEGTVRDLIRQVQNMRKEADLRVEDRIVVGISGDGHIAESLEHFKDYFLAEVLGTELSAKLDYPEHQKVVNLSGSDVSIHIARA